MSALHDYVNKLGYVELANKTTFDGESLYLPYEAAYTDSDGLVRPCFLAIHQNMGTFNVVHVMDAHLTLIKAQMEIAYRRDVHRYRVTFPDWTTGAIEFRKPLLRDRFKQRFMASFRNCNPRLSGSAAFQECIGSMEGDAENNGHPKVVHTHNGCVKDVRDVGYAPGSRVIYRLYDDAGTLIFDPNERENIVDARDWKRRKEAAAFRTERGLKPIGRS